MKSHAEMTAKATELVGHPEGSVEKDAGWLLLNSREKKRVWASPKRVFMTCFSLLGIVTPLKRKLRNSCASSCSSNPANILIPGSGCSHMFSCI